MATKQASTPTTTPDPTGGVPLPQNAGAASKSVSQPIGVPFYVTDPATGQPVLGSDGQPLRWGAQGTTTNSEDDLRYRGGRPGTRQIVTTQPTYTLPRYYDGAQWLPASLPPDQLAQLQRQMVAAGLLKSGQAQLGVWDAASMNAYTQLLAYANASGLDAGTALSQWGQAHALDPNAGKAPLQVKVTNPEDLRKVFRQSVIDTLGQGWDTAKIDQMVSAYQATETAAQQQAYNQADSGGTVTAPPDPGTFAADQVRQEDPTGAQAHDALGYEKQFFAALKGVVD